jgi:predicted amidophosphoribosyltransferase
MRNNMTEKACVSDGYSECAQCGEKVYATYSFCTKCGANLDMYECIQCGADIPVDSEICPECGFNIYNDTEEETGTRKDRG